jgi:hypothetical protein
VADVAFDVEGVEAAALAASPELVFKLRVGNPSGEPVHTILLRCQIQLEAARRSYSEIEQKRLRDLFGPAELWGRTLRSMLWTNTIMVVPAFSDSVVVDLHASCTFDFNVAATKFFAGLEGGDVPVGLFFSGTVFYGDGGTLRIGQIPWDKEIHCRMPVRVWREMMDRYYPNTAWLCLRRDVFDRLYERKVRNGAPTWEEAIGQLLSATEAAGPSE